MGEFDEFERAVKLVLENVRFDRDVVVSVFETNIRVIGYNYIFFILNLYFCYVHCNNLLK